jgi:predicted AAA+ superfamily ATPase
LTDFSDFWQILRDRGINREKRVFVFVDEIQHLPNPSSFLKYLHDHCKPNLKFIVTGPSSLEIKKNFTDRLTGSVYRFVVKPLSFHEFLEFKNEKAFAEMLAPFHFSF